MKSAAPPLALFACLALVALPACDRKAADGDSAAAKLEGAVERGKEQLAAAGEKTQEALGSASARLQPKIEAAGDRIADAAGQVTTTITTGDRTSASATPGPGERGDGGAAAGDMAITASIKAGLLKDPDLSAFGIDVDTREGVVTMNGVAGDEAARTRATRIAESVKGVKEVRNHLAVKKG